MLKIRYAGYVLIIIFGVQYFYEKSAELSQLKNLTLTQIGAASVAVFLTQLITGRKYKTLFSVLKIKLTPREWFGLPQVTAFLNLLFFKSGTVTNAYFLKKHHEVSYSRFIAAMSVQKILDFFVAIFFGFMISLFIFSFFEIDFYVVLVFCLMLAALLCFFFYPPIHIKKWKSHILNKIYKIIEASNEYKQNKPVMFKIILLQMIAIPILGIRYYIAFNILNNPVSIAECVIISVVVSVTGLVSIIPGNIGIRETIVGMSAYYMDYSFDYGVFATTLDRIIATAWAGFWGLIFFHLLHLKGYSKKNTSAF